MRSYQHLFSTLLLAFVVFILSCKTDTAFKETPVVFTLGENQLANYEKNIDHKVLITEIVEKHDESIANGQKIYNSQCVTCHGTPSQEGSIPTAFKYWKDKFKVGKDPYSIYQTLTRGYGSMPPQTHLTPIEKYQVIYFLREEFLVQKNKTEYFNIDSLYLSTLPLGKSKGPAPLERKPWVEMDYGNFFINTYELVDSAANPREISQGEAPMKDEDLSTANFAYKGIAIRLDEGTGGVAAGKAWMVFDHDLMRVAGGWTGEGFIDWQGILLNGSHNISPRTIGTLHFSTPVSPAWANPSTGTFTDIRFIATDKRRFGPLPKDWAHYKGLYRYNNKAILSYSVGNANILELDGLEGSNGDPVFTRELNISPSDRPLKMRVASINNAVALMGDGVTLKKDQGFFVLEIPQSKAVMLKLLIAKKGTKHLDSIVQASKKPGNLVAYTKGSVAQYQKKLITSINTGKGDSPFQVDRLELPFHSPWKNQLRLSGIDFLEDKNKAVVCSTDGDVWLVDGITKKTGKLSWQRIASGLFQPLGIKVVEKKIFVTCRDQLVKLHDLNGDEEIDFYESFNSDHQVTNHFHEFAMGLQTDKEGNFYYAKSGRHARKALVPQHGTLLKVTKDGQHTEIIANGFRAANGVCINPDGSFIVTDQEGHWNPMNRINWVKSGNNFYGNMFGYTPSTDSSDTSMEQPLAWVERSVDQSPSELLWVDSKRWGPLNGSLLSFSYGYGKVFVVPHEKVGTQMQGGLFELPIPRFSTGVMRGRFNTLDGKLYACGLSAWGSSGSELGGLYRIRYNGGKSIIPIALNATSRGISIKFSHPLDIKNSIALSNTSTASTPSTPSTFKIQTWDLQRSRKYGSGHHNKKTLVVSKVELSKDRKEVLLTIPGIKPTWVMQIEYDFVAANGKHTKGLIQNTINTLEK